MTCYTVPVTVFWDKHTHEHEHRLVDKENETGVMIFGLKDVSCCWGSCFVCLGVAFLLSGACRSAPCEDAMGCLAGLRRHSADPLHTIR